MFRGKNAGSREAHVGRNIDEQALVVSKVGLFTVNSKSSMMKSQIDSRVIRRMI